MLPPCLIGFGLALPFGREAVWVRRFLRLVGRRLGLRVSVVGTPLPAPVLYVANHLSWFDILAVGGTVAPRFVSKGEVRGWPLVGWLARLGGTLFIERERRAQVGAQADALGTALLRGRPALLFAEGTTGDGKAVMPFRPALFAAVAGGATPLQPVAIDYGAATPQVAWIDEEPFFANAGRLLLLQGTLPVTLRFLPPIDPASLDRKALAAAAHAAIAGSLGHRHPL